MIGHDAQPNSMFLRIQVATARMDMILVQLGDQHIHIQQCLHKSIDSSRLIDQLICDDPSPLVDRPEPELGFEIPRRLIDRSAVSEARIRSDATAPAVLDSRPAISLMAARTSSSRFKVVRNLNPSRSLVSCRWPHHPIRITCDHLVRMLTESEWSGLDGENQSYWAKLPRTFVGRPITGFAPAAKTACSEKTLVDRAPRRVAITRTPTGLVFNQVSGWPLSEQAVGHSAWMRLLVTSPAIPSGSMSGSCSGSPCSQTWGPGGRSPPVVKCLRAAGAGPVQQTDAGSPHPILQRSWQRGSAAGLPAVGAGD